MEAIIKDNIKMEYPMEGESLDGPMELDIQAFGREDCNRDKEQNYMMADSKKGSGRMGIGFVGDDIL